MAENRNILLISVFDTEFLKIIVDLFSDKFEIMTSGEPVSVIETYYERIAAVFSDSFDVTKYIMKKGLAPYIPVFFIKTHRNIDVNAVEIIRKPYNAEKIKLLVEKIIGLYALRIGERNINVEYSSGIIEKEFYENILFNINGGIFRYKKNDYSIEYISRGVYELLGCSSEEEFRSITDNKFINMIHPSDMERIKMFISNSSDEIFEHRIIKKNGTVCWVANSSRKIVDQNGNEWVYCIIIDINAFMQKQHYYRYKSKYDSLTGAYDRQEAFIEIKEYIEKEPCLMSVIDIDDFKKINDEYGHPAGDKVLIHLVKKLKSSFRADDIVARLGGDEFMIFLKAVKTEKARLRMIKRLEGLCKNALADIDDEALREKGITFCMGIKCAEKGENPEEMYQKADRALYIAKRSGKARAYVWEENKQEVQI